MHRARLLSCMSPFSSAIFKRYTPSNQIYTIQYQCLSCYHLWTRQSLPDSLSRITSSLSPVLLLPYIYWYTCGLQVLYYLPSTTSSVIYNKANILHHFLHCFIIRALATNQSIHAWKNHTRHLYIAAVRCVSEIRHFFLFIIGYFIHTYALYFLQLNYNFEKLILYFVVESRIFTIEKVQKERQQYQRSFIATRPLLGMDQKGYSLIKYRV